MSKSDPSDLSRITMLDSADEIAKKIRKAKTDPEVLPESQDGLAGRPGGGQSIGHLRRLAEQEMATAISQFAGQQFSALKEALAELAIAKIAPIGDEMRRLNDDPGAVDAVLADGAARPAPLPNRLWPRSENLSAFWEVKPDFACL